MKKGLAQSAGKQLTSGKHGKKELAAIAVTHQCGKHHWQLVVNAGKGTCSKRGKINNLW